MRTPPNTVRLTSGIQQSAYAGVSKYYYYNQFKQNISLTHISSGLAKLLKAPMRRAGHEMRYYNSRYDFYPTQVSMEMLPLNLYFKMEPHTKKVYVNTQFYNKKRLSYLSYLSSYKVSVPNSMCKLIQKKLVSNIMRRVSIKHKKVNKLKVNTLSLSVLKQCFQPVVASDNKREFHYQHLFKRPDIYNRINEPQKSINVLEHSEYYNLKYLTNVNARALKKYFRKTKRYSPIPYMYSGTKRHAQIYFWHEARANAWMKARLKAKKRVYRKPKMYKLNHLKDLVNMAPNAIRNKLKMVYTNQVFNGPTGVTNMYLSKYPLRSRTTKFNAKSLESRNLKSQNYRDNFNKHQPMKNLGQTTISFKLYEQQITHFKKTLQTYISIWI